MAEERLKLFGQLISVAVLSVLFSNLMTNDFSAVSPDEQETATDLIINDQLNNGTTLEVKPAIGQPKPLSSPLQSPGQTEQQARGKLQQPQTSDELQPNAGSDQIPQAFLE